MANIKFSAFTQKVDQANVDFLVGYTGTDNVRIAPSTIGQGVYVLKAGDTMTGALQMGANFAAQIPINFGDANFQISTENNYTADNLDNLKFKVPDAAAGGFRFTNANDDEIFFAQGDGKIGINTVTPQKTLDVNLGGNTGISASFAGTISTGEYQGVHIGYSEPGNTKYRKSAIVFERDDAATGNAQGNIYILNNVQNNDTSATLSDQRMKISNNTNVGIGQDLRPQYPEAKLTVNSDPGNTSQPDRITTSVVDSHTGLFLNGTGNAINEKYGLQFGWYSGYSTGGIFVVGDNVAGSTSGDMTFDMGDGTSAGALVERMRLTHEGRLGIGTDSPDRLFEIESAGTGEMCVTGVSGSSVYFRPTLSYSPGGNFGIIVTGGPAPDYLSTMKISGYSTNAGGVNTIMTLLGSGNVGINNTSPQAQLDVVGRIELNDGNDNVFVGADAGEDITTGQNNVAIGVNALKSEAAGGRSVAIGKAALAFQKDGSTAAYNIAIGYETGLSVTTGVENALVGGLAGDAVTTGSYNAALGTSALGANTKSNANVAIGNSALAQHNLTSDTAGYNVAVGFNAGVGVTTGTHNTLLGALAGDALTTAANNVAIGYGALSADVLGSDNVAIGLQAMSATDNARANVAVGFNALQSLDYASLTYSHNIGIGFDAGKFITTGIQNTLIGGQVGDALTEGSDNVAVGYLALSNENTHGRNVALGKGALQSQRAGADAYNIAIGYNAGINVSTGLNQVLIGGNAGVTLSDGANNVAIGRSALGTASSDSNNTAIGYAALGTQNGAGTAYNVAVGHQAGTSVTTGVSNTILGGQAGDALSTSSYNVAVGHLALTNEVASGGNVAVGYKSLNDSAGGANNTALGYQSGENITTGDANTIIGSQAGDALTTGSNNTVIGRQAAASAVGVSNEITLGDTNITALRCQVTSITALSDKRDKKDIKDSTYGLDFVDSLKPVTFEWDQRDGNRSGVKDLGFIAQDLQEVDDEYTRLVYGSNSDKLEATYGRLIPVLVKAIQDLSAKVKELENK